MTIDHEMLLRQMILKSNDRLPVSHTGTLESATLIVKYTLRTSCRQNGSIL